MKTYLAYFWRSNPQLAAGGYETTREYHVSNKAELRKMVACTERSCVYGGMNLLRVEQVK